MAVPAEACRRVCAPRAPQLAIRPPRRGAEIALSRRLVVVRSTDYAASATDEGVLQLPAKQELEEEQLRSVFGYDRDLRGRCAPRISSFRLVPRKELGGRRLAADPRRGVWPSSRR
jgi:hypothetical protein